MQNANTMMGKRTCVTVAVRAPQIRHAGRSSQDARPTASRFIASLVLHAVVWHLLLFNARLERAPALLHLHPHQHPHLHLYQASCPLHPLQHRRAIAKERGLSVVPTARRFTVSQLSNEAMVLLACTIQVSRVCATTVRAIAIYHLSVPSTSLLVVCHARRSIALILLKAKSALTQL